MEKKIKVLIIDDSFFIRFLISNMLNSDREIDTITAKNYEETIKKLKLKPNVIILNIEMPGVSGLDILSQIMKKKPTPVIIISSKNKLNRKDAITAIKYGAIDVIEIPKKSKEILKLDNELIDFVKVVSSADVEKLVVKKPKKRFKIPERSKKIIVIGASSGGPVAIESILTSLPREFPTPIVVLQHMPARFTETFAKRLNKSCNIEVREAENGDEIKPGKVLIAKGDKNLEVTTRENKKLIKLNNKPAPIKPSIDMALNSIAKVYKDKSIVLILTGMGSDGAQGIKEIKREKGTTIVQDKNTSLIFGMPKAVIEQGCADFILPLDKMVKKIFELI